MSHSLSKLLILYAQQFEDQQAPQNMTIALREAADTITRFTAENERLRAALEGVLKAGVYNDACECMSCEMARAALSGDKQ